MYDIIIIGAGVSGCACARELSRYDAKILVVEKEEDVCCGTSKANSAIVHAGYDAAHGSLMAKLNVEGSRRMPALAKELDFAYEQCGSLVVCLSDEDRPALQKLYENGIANGVEGLRIIERDELVGMEPNISDAAVAALWVPTGGIVCPFGLTFALAENAAKNGVQFRFDTKVTGLHPLDGGGTGWAVETDHGTLETRCIVNAAGVSPSQASIETILKVDLYGTAVLLEEVGKVIKEDGVGVTISSQSGHRMPALTIEEDMLLATTPTEELLSLDMLQPDSIKDTLHAYQMAKRCNVKRVMAEAVKWGERGARINSISPGIIVTPLAIDEFNGPRGDFYKNMFAKCPAGRPGTADEVANVAELLMSDRGAFITGADFLIDGGATASYFYGPLKP